jgi:hypothetical protein
MTMAEEMWVMNIVVLESPIDEAGHITDILQGRITTRYLRAFYPDRHGGRGEIFFTDDPAEARKFDSFTAVMECWKTQSKVRPLRLDGRPNRPLTAFTIQPERLNASRAKGS